MTIPIPLKGGFYQARSPLASAQRCVNLYPEKNPEDSPQPYSMYLTPGLTLLRAGDSTDGPVSGTFRGLYRASDGAAFGVVGQTLYFIDEQWRFYNLLSLSTVSNNPVSMYDNGTYLVLVDGSPTAYTVELNDLSNTGTLTLGDNYLGSDRVDYLDSFLLFNEPNTKNFYCTNSDSLTISPLDIAAKTGLPDNIQTFIVIHREIWLLGTDRSTEIWNNVGQSGFPFALLPGVFIEQGCIAKYSIAKNDLMVFWLGRNKDGIATVFQGKGYAANRISTPAISVLLSRLTTLSDAIGMIYMQQDHVFYVLSFPTDNITIVYDASEGLWHERTWTDENGSEHRIRANCMAQLYDSIVCGDHTNGNLYKLDLSKYVDEVNGVNTTPGESDSVSPIVRRRGFPHLIQGLNKVSYPSFRPDVQSGEASGDLTEVPIYLRWSDDRGRTWSDPISTTLGLTGNFINSPQFNQLGMARDRVFELFWSAPVETVLMGAYIGEPINSGS